MIGKFMHRLRQRYEADRAAIETSNAHLENVIQTAPEDDKKHEDALQSLHEATEQAKRLAATDHHNHYSESLTQAFRGKIA